MSTETQRAEFEAWCDRHDLPPHLYREAFDDAVSIGMYGQTSQAAEIEALRKVSEEYNAWIRFQAAGHDYDEFLRMKLGCTKCRQYRDATGELVIPLCRCKAAMQTKEAS